MVRKINLINIFIIVTHDCSIDSGDEYAVYWHSDLIPTTENFAPYEYDSQEKPKKLERPVTREDIRQIVLEISEQDALGRLSNLHLAFTDKFNIRHPDAIKLAAAIAEEVDSGKTGKHPLTDNEISEIARKLNHERADFFNRPKQFDHYASSNTIGMSTTAHQAMHSSFYVDYMPFFSRYSFSSCSPIGSDVV